MPRHHADEEDDERPRWRDADDDDEPKDWEIEPEEEKEDTRPVLTGAEPVARFLFLAILAIVVLGGVIAFVLGILSWIGR